MVGRSHLGAGVRLANGSYLLHCVIPALTEKRTKRSQLALHLMLLDPLVKSGYTGNTGKHKACFISVTVLFSKFALGQTSYPVTSTQVLHVNF